MKKCLKLKNNTIVKVYFQYDSDISLDDLSDLKDRLSETPYFFLDTMKFTFFSFFQLYYILNFLQLS